ncbi:MAG TPA: alpha/beta hydrolase [Polyangia bacterium]
MSMFDNRFLLFVGVVAAAGALVVPAGALAQTDKPAIVLVHGAFADASAWAEVIPALQRAGHHVVGVQNPLRSFEDDVATTKRVIEAQKGPVIAVGHSYGGAVITAAASGSKKVTALVYVTAFAPEANEAIGALYEKEGKPELLGALVPDETGLVTIDRARFRELFAGDVSPAQAAVMAATQKPIAANNFKGMVVVPAWKTIPSWYLIAKSDRAITPSLQEFMAKRIDAKIGTVNASHVPFASKPKDVASFILKAAAATVSASR